MNVYLEFLNKYDGLKYRIIVTENNYDDIYQEYISTIKKINYYNSKFNLVQRVPRQKLQFPKFNVLNNITSDDKDIMLKLMINKYEELQTKCRFLSREIMWIRMEQKLLDEILNIMENLFAQDSDMTISEDLEVLSR